MIAGRPGRRPPHPITRPARLGPRPAGRRRVALLTAGYSAGQILGPLVVTPLLRHGYHEVLLLATLLVLAAAAAAGVLRVGFPHHVPARTT